ncbi:hypothetical protein APV34_13675 [Staphylococcus aureus]|nr:hypothetical protein APV34_13675 [Staphylococcus aureus]
MRKIGYARVPYTDQNLDVEITHLLINGCDLVFSEKVFIYSKVGKSAQTIVVEGRKGGNQGLEIMPPFYIYNEDGNYSEEMKDVYYG